MFRIISLVAGILFGLGMALSGMADPNKVIAFLDVAGDWDPSLAFVMGGALAVFLPVYFLLIKKRSQPIVSETFCVSQNSVIDKPLLIGAALFGIGWGLVGVCPGPVISSLGAGNSQAWLFLVAMLVGFSIAGKVLKAK
ncbi:transporter [Vibrio sp. UCD-FRSSP16_10]|uniref:YeeE/YedE family protein n=1 Tax=unclassified Vibrio TaxID=2614977 RepID=UPI0007FEF63D|nr:MULTISPECIES: YeeE/YedE family protein [unclassified Vibrio]OBT07966.1 transporter [Vibrio sp. UCD-FRSSP16_30]OBT17141.1 transporter [Vibrio sp. UCD-FRSSP16_10]